MNLTQLARKTLEMHFHNKKFELDEKTKKTYCKKQACFVTLTKKGNLRGCIGSLQATQSLWKDVQGNVLNAAFNDPSGVAMESIGFDFSQQQWAISRQYFDAAPFFMEGNAAWNNALENTVAFGNPNFPDN